MAAQFDFNPGLDISPLASVTKAQFIQALQQIAPLSNIGGIVAQAATSHTASIGNGLNGAPSVTDNPRFIRYIWLNTYDSANVPPVPYFYDLLTAAWISITVAAGSILDIHVGAGAQIQLSKLDSGAANQLIRCNGAGVPTYVAAASAIIAGDNIVVGALAPHSGNGFLSTTSSVAAWLTDAQAALRFLAAITPGSITLNLLAPGTNGHIMSMAGGNWVSATVENALPAFSVSLSKLSATGAAFKQIIRFDGTNWVPFTPPFSGAPFTNLGVLIAIPAAGATVGFNHGLGDYPKIVRWVAVANGTATTAHGYAANDEVDLNAFRNTADFVPSFNTYATGSGGGVFITIEDNSYIMHKSTGAMVATTRNQAATDFSLKVFAVV